MELTARLRAWTHRRQCLTEPAPTALSAMRAVVAVYSFHPTAPLALLARTAAMSAEAFRALDGERLALRVPGMRGSIFLAPAETADEVFAATPTPRARLLQWLGRVGIDESTYAALSASLVTAMSEPRLPRELVDVAGGLAPAHVSLVLRVARAEGRVLAVASGSLRSGQLRYVATAAWAPGTLGALDATEALERLAGRYLLGYGPVRVADFAWWAGVSRRAATTALAAHPTVDVGEGLLLPIADLAAFEAIRPVSGTINLLPKWDAYTMGLAPDGRARLVHPDNQSRLYVRAGVVAPGQPNVGLPGDGYPAVLIDGEAMGTWNVTLKGANVDLFERVGPAVATRVNARLRQVEDLLAG